MPSPPEERCTVCYLPSADPVCSERCRRMRRRRAAIDALGSHLDDAVVAAVRALPPGATACPGVLGEGVLRAHGFDVDARDALLLLRERLFALRDAGRLRFLQKGVVVPRGKRALRGPFRLGS
jgi:hypothetical protein